MSKPFYFPGGSTPSRSRSRSSSPDDIPRRGAEGTLPARKQPSPSPTSGGARGGGGDDSLSARATSPPPPVRHGSRSQAPLQKRLGALASGGGGGGGPTSGLIRNIKKEPEDRPVRHSSGSPSKKPGPGGSGGNANLEPLGPSRSGC